MDIRLERAGATPVRGVQAVVSLPRAAGSPRSVFRMMVRWAQMEALWKKKGTRV